MIWKEIDLFNIAKNIKPLVSGNEMFLDLSNVEANGHRENVDNRKVECIRAMGEGIGLDSIKKVLLSLDNINYETVDIKDRLELDEQGRLEINLHEDYKVKYIKLIWNSRIPVQNIQIEVLNRKFVGLVIANATIARNGWGDRLLSITNALSYADTFDYKFGFVWLPFSSSDSPFTMEPVENIFSTEFIDIYNYNSKLEKYGISQRNNFITNTNNINKPQYWGGGMTCGRSLAASNFMDAWKKINFNDSIQSVLNKAKIVAQDFRSRMNYICINMRIGEMVYSSTWYNAMSRSAKVTPAEIVIELIETLNNNVAVILLSDTPNTMRRIENYFKNSNKKVYCAVDILPKQTNSSKKALQEIIFMSHAKEIYDHGYSGFARIPSLMAFGREPRTWELDFTITEQLNIISKNFEKIERPKEEKGYSKYIAYTLYRKLYPNDWQGMSKILLEATAIFPENIKYRWRLAECFVKLNELSKAQEQLEKMLQIEDIGEILRSFNHCEKDNPGDKSGTLIYTFPLMAFLLNILQKSKNENLICSKDLKNKNAQLNTELFNIKDLLSNKDKEIQSLKKDLKTLTEDPETKYKLLQIKNLELKNKKLDFEIKTTQENFRIPIYINQAQSAKNRIENHLAYKLGEAIIENSKSFLGIIRIPFVLSYISQSHHKKLANQKEQLPKIETLPDYKEAIKIKEQMTYKLGEAWIKGYKTWYKGGLIKFYFEAQKIKNIRKELK